jgi:hypothetical protein
MSINFLLQNDKYTKTLATTVHRPACETGAFKRACGIGYRLKTIGYAQILKNKTGHA